MGTAIDKRNFIKGIIRCLSQQAAAFIFLLILSNPLHAHQKIDYDKEVHRIQRLIAGGNLGRAEHEVARLLKFWPRNSELLAMQARIAFWQGRYDEAETVYHLLLRQSPSRTWELELEKVVTTRSLRRAAALQAQGDLDAAEREFAFLVKKGVGYDAELGLAMVRLRKREFEAADSLLAELARRYPADHGVETLHLEALVALATGEGKEPFSPSEVTKVENLLDRCLVERSADPDLLTLKGRLLHRTDRHEEALPYYRKAELLRPSPLLIEELDQAETAALLDQSNRLHQTGNTKEEAAILERLLAQGKAAHDAGYRLGLIRLRNGEYEKAFRTLEPLVISHAGDSDLEAPYLQALLGRRSVGDTLKAIDQLLYREPDNSALLTAKARFLAWQGDYPAAGAIYRKLLARRDGEAIRHEAERVEMALRFPPATPIGRAVKASYRTDPNLLPLEARAAMEAGHKEDALTVWETLVRLRPDDIEAARQVAAVRTAIRLEEAGRLEKLGRTDEARAILKELYTSRAARYDAGFRLGILLVRDREYDTALNYFATLHEEFPDDPEVTRLVAAVRTAIRLEEAGRLEKLGRTIEARAILKELYTSRDARYEAGCRLAILLIRDREYDAALDCSAALHEEFPNDPDVEGLYVEALLLTGKLDRAKTELEQLPKEMKKLLEKEREDLFYRAIRNRLSLLGSFEAYSGSYANSGFVATELTQRTGWGGVTGRVEHDFRFGKENTQISADFSRKTGERSNGWWHVYATLSPDATFLPNWSGGGAVYRGMGAYEFSFGYNHLAFTAEGVDILVPGVTHFFANGLRVEEKVYVVPVSGSYSFATTLAWERDHRLSAYAALSIGESAERISSVQDIRPFFSWSPRLGGEYRFTPLISVGAELFHTHRNTLYNTTGATLVTRYWW